MNGKREIDALLRQTRDWLDPPGSLMARPVELPPMVPIKDPADPAKADGDGGED